MYYYGFKINDQGLFEGVVYHFSSNGTIQLIDHKTTPQFTEAEASYKARMWGEQNGLTPEWDRTWESTL